MKAEHIAAVAALLGMLALAALSLTTRLSARENPYPLCSDTGQNALISGKITYINSTPGRTFIVVSYEINMQIVYYNAVNLTKGDYIQAKGRLNLYNGELKLIASDLRKLD